MTQPKALLIFSASFIFLLTGYKAHTQENQKSGFEDTAFYKVDTVLNNVLIDGGPFRITVLRDKFDEHLQRFSEEGEPAFTQSPITIVLSKGENNKRVYLKRFDFEPADYPYLNYSFYKGQNQGLDKPGKLYLMLHKSYGGSGSESVRYFINFSEGQINLNHLFNSSGELAYVVYSKNDNEILLLEGIWGEGESHFANHRYKIRKFLFNNGSFEETTVGQTKGKYSSLDEDKPVQQILTEMKAKEPLLLQNIEITDYNF